ncbi:hypothetical protein KAI04_03955 [Candidatus Pacearchaeota archaeon]|nr:hypothetical protein [Candidatus Pacearchaeota archaeon]
MTKTSKELKAIQNAIQKYIDKHEGDVQFVGSFMAFEGENSNVVDDLVMAYGFKDILLLDLKEILKNIKKEEEFVNW